MSLNLKKYDYAVLIPGMAQGTRTMGLYKCKFIAVWWLWFKVEIFYGL